MRLTLLAGAAGLFLAACATEVKVPVADAGQDVRVPAGGALPAFPVLLDGSRSSDPQGLPLSYSWAFRTLPAGSVAVLNDPHAVSPSFLADATGTYEVLLVVSNGIKQSTAAKVTVTADPTVGTVVPVGGFTASVAYSGAAASLSSPQGVAVGPGGELYVAESNPTPVGPRITRHASGVSTVLAQGGYLRFGVADVIWDATGTGRLLVSNGADNTVVAIDPTSGVQSLFPAAAGGSRFYGLAAVPQAGGPRILAADRNANQVDIFTTAGAAAANSPVLAGAGPGAIWGVGGVSIGGADVVYAAFDGEVWRQAGAAAPTRLSDVVLLSALRGLAVTPCSTPKVIVASNNTGTLTVLDDCATTGCANANARQLVTGLGTPVGLAFSSGTTPSLYVADSSMRTIYKIDGNFCSL